MWACYCAMASLPVLLFVDHLARSLDHFARLLRTHTQARAMDPDDLFSVFDDGGSDASTQQSSSSRPATGNKRSASSSSVQSPAPAAKRPRVEQPTPITPKRQTTPAAVAPVASAAPSVDAPSTTSEMPPTSGASTVTAADAVESSSASTPSAQAASSASSSYLLGEGPIELGQEATERETEIIRDCIHEVAYPPDWRMYRNSRALSRSSLAKPVAVAVTDCIPISLNHSHWNSH